MDRNIVLAVVLSMAVLLGWELLVVGPQREALEAQRAVDAEAAAETTAPDPAAALGLTPDEASAARGSGEIPLGEALAQGPGRVRIETQPFYSWPQ